MTPEDANEVARLTQEAVDLLGALALRKRTKLGRRESYALEDGLFAVLEALNNLKVDPPLTEAQIAAVVRVAEVAARVKDDGTS